MRGRTLFKEPSLCAFCAHRIDTHRVQRRLLHSTRSTTRPQAEAIAFREDNGAASQSHSAPPLRRPGIPVAGGPSPAGGIPLRTRGPAEPIVLPHETRIKEMMMQDQFSQPNIMKYPANPLKPPEPEPRQRQDWRLVRKIHDRETRGQAIMRVSRAARSIRPSDIGVKEQSIPNHVIGEEDKGNIEAITTAKDISGTSQWSQLRKTTFEPLAGPQPPPQAAVPPRISKFAQERSRREEKSKTGLYTPIGSSATSNTPTFSRLVNGPDPSSPFSGYDSGRPGRHAPSSWTWKPSASGAEDKSEVASGEMRNQPVMASEPVRRERPSGLAQAPTNDSVQNLTRGIPVQGNVPSRGFIPPKESSASSSPPGKMPLRIPILPRGSSPVSSPPGSVPLREPILSTGRSPASTTPPGNIPLRDPILPKEDSSSSRSLSRDLPLDQSTPVKDGAAPSSLDPLMENSHAINLTSRTDAPPALSDAVEKAVASQKNEDAVTAYSPALGPLVSEPTEHRKQMETTYQPVIAEKEQQKASENKEGKGVIEERKRHRRGRLADVDIEEDLDELPREKHKNKPRRRSRDEDDEDGMDEEQEARAAARLERKRQRKLEKAAKKAAASAKILLPEYISVSNLAIALKVRVEDFHTKLQELGFEDLSNDHILNAENSGLIAMEYNYEPIIDRGESKDLKARTPAENPSDLPPRPPVVTIMGHVDHGKTTILDWLRKSSVAASEHGGITQHIGAFSVLMPSGKTITFLDTPGHAAFLDMRQRGANVTDIVILVVAADDSVKPQTIEAISHAKAAKVPIIVAINKIDKEDIDVDRVKQDLARYGVDVEDYGGDTQVVCLSGKTGQGMPDLESAAVALSEILDMRAEVDGQAEGWVLEASIKATGKVATVLVRRGTIRPGDVIVAGKTWARVRCMRNEAGIEIESAGPGTPVEIDGWRSQPEAGDDVLQAIDESKAKSVVDYRLEKEERDKLSVDMEAINENRAAVQEQRQREKEAAEAAEAAILDGVEAMNAKPTHPEAEGQSKCKQLGFIIKADVSGSLEAVINSIMAIGNAEVRPHIIRTGVGQISESDISHAAAAKGHVINFNTSVETTIQRMADEAKVKVLDHNIIYRLADDVKVELENLLSPSVTFRVLGEAEVAQIFRITVKGRKQRPVAGCKVKNGVLGRNGKVRVMRRGEKVFDRTLSSLKSGKKDVNDAKRGNECGLAFEGWDDFQLGDQVQAYEENREKRYL